MCMEYANQLTIEELKEIYQLFLEDGDKILALDIYRSDDEIILRGKVEIDTKLLKAIPDATVIIDNDYYLEVNIYDHHHFYSEKFNEIYRKYMFETFGLSYALDFLFNYNLVMSEEEENEE